MKGAVITFSIVGIIVLTFSCGRFEKDPEQLAKTYCSSCHLFPEPSLLDKKTWEKSVLPEMAFRMGVDYGLLQNISERDMPEVLKALPSNAMVTPEQWKAIHDYYLQQAPDSIASIAEREIPEVRQFEVSPIRLPLKTAPLLTLVRYDSANRKLFIGTRHSSLYKLNSEFIPEDSFKLNSPPSDIIVAANNELLLACMGIMDPNDQFAGSIVRLNTDSHAASVLIDSIKRPVDIQMTDMNNDQQNDFVVSAFGNYTGALEVYERSRNGYEQHFIHTWPGTRKTIIRDFNDDGLNDILALVTQGDEQILLLINEGKFGFRPRVLLRFPPVYGSSYFDIHDFNNDGAFDILYTNGDNLDYSAILKPYHGVRIYLNDGKNRFTESWFYPMHGASQAVSRDFDKDGDLDVAAIAFFPDFQNHPEQGFLYFENTDGKFLPFITPLASSGRWLTMEAADIDQDGDEDLLLGALNFTATVPKLLTDHWRAKETSLLVLRNNYR